MNATLSRLALLSLLCAPFATLAQAQLSLNSDPDKITLTLYHQDLAHIQDQRAIPALDANQSVYIEGVSPQLLTETLRIQGAGQVLEQSLIPAQLNYDRLLETHVGKPVTLAYRNPVSGDETLSRVTLLSLDGLRALVRQESGRVEPIDLYDSAWRFLFEEVPAQLNAQPVLGFRTQGTEAPGLLTLSYLSHGLGWSMDYRVNLAQNGRSLSLEGLASLHNLSGTDFNNASLRLMAGDVKQGDPEPHRIMRAMAMADSYESAAPVQPSSLQGYYIYRWPSEITLKNQEHKLIPLISAQDLPAVLSYQHSFPIIPILDNQRYDAQPNIQLRFNLPNIMDSSSPAPAGNIRVFRPDTEGEMQFIGAGSIGNLGSGEEASVTLGQAMDLSIQRRQVMFTDNEDSLLIQYEVTVSNSARESRQVDLSAQFQQAWTLTESTHVMQEDNAGKLSWTMNLPAMGAETIRFTVELKKRMPRN